MLRSIWRRIRGVLGTALTWAAGWAGVGALFWVIDGGSILAGAVTVGIAGFATGAAFAVVLAIAEGRRTLDELALRRVAIWGGVGGLIVGGLTLAAVFAGGTPLPWSTWMGQLIRVASLGAGSAAGNVALARWAGRAELTDGPDRHLLEG